MRTERPLAAASAVYDEATSIYRKAFGPLVAVAGVVALSFNAMSFFATPSFFLLHISWGLLVNFMGVTMLASAVLVPAIVALRASAGSGYGSPMAGLREHGWHIALATLLLVLANAILVFSFLGIALSALLTARLAFIAVAASIEDQDVTDSLARSWELTDGHTKRTGAVLLGAVVPMAALLVLLSLAGFSTPVTVIVMVIGEALVVPFVIAVLVIMFEEYRAMRPEPEDFGPKHRQPPFR